MNALPVAVEAAAEEAATQTVTLTIIEGGAAAGAAEVGGAVVAGEAAAGGAAALGIGGAVVATGGVALVVLALGALGYWLYESSQPKPLPSPKPLVPCRAPKSAEGTETQTSKQATPASSVSTSPTADAEAAKKKKEEEDETRCRQDRTLPDSTFVVRGGVPTPNQIRNGSEWIDQFGRVHGVSVESGAGLGLIELSKPLLRYNQVGFTTVGQIRAAGGNVYPSPRPGNPNHATLCGVTAETASGLMKVIKNPAKSQGQ